MLVSLLVASLSVVRQYPNRAPAAYCRLAASVRITVSLSTLAQALHTGTADELLQPVQPNSHGICGDDVSRLIITHHKAGSEMAIVGAAAAVKRKNQLCHTNDPVPSRSLNVQPTPASHCRPPPPASFLVPRGPPRTRCPPLFLARV